MPRAGIRPLLATADQPRVTWGRLHGSRRGLAIAEAQAKHRGLTIVLAPDAPDAEVLEQELRFFRDHADTLLFPDWETLPYDVFSPYEDIISQRLETLYRLRRPERPAYAMLKAMAGELAAFRARDSHFASSPCHCRRLFFAQTAIGCPPATTIS